MPQPLQYLITETHWVSERRREACQKSTFPLGASFSLSVTRLCPQFYDKDVKLQIIFTTLTCRRIYQGIYKPDVYHSTPNPMKCVTWGKVLDKDSLKKSIIIKLETLTTLILKVPCYLTCFLCLLNTRAGNDLKLETKISPRFTEVKYLYSNTLIPKIFMRFQMVCS